MNWFIVSLVNGPAPQWHQAILGIDVESLSITPLGKIKFKTNNDNSIQKNTHIETPSDKYRYFCQCMKFVLYAMCVNIEFPVLIHQL